MVIRTGSVISGLIVGLILADLVQHLLFGVIRLTWLTELLVAVLIVPVVTLTLLRAAHLSRLARGVILGVSVYFIFMTLGTLYYGNPGTNPVEAIALDVFLDAKSYVLALLLVLTLDRTRITALIRTVCWILIAAALINLPFVILDILRGSVSIHGQPLVSRGGFTVPVGLFDHKVRSAQLALFGTIAALALSVKTDQSRRQGWLYAAALVLALSVLIHLSVKEIAALGVVGLLYAFMRGGGRIGLRLSATAAVFVLVTTVLIPGTPLNTALENRLNLFIGGEEVTVRNAAYTQSVQIALDTFPLGSGAATFMSKGARDLAYSPYYFEYGLADIYGARPENPLFIMDTYWPKILAQGGVFGFASYVLAMLAVGVMTCRLLRQDPSMVHFYAAAVLASMSISSLATPVLTHDNIVAILALAFAIVMMPQRGLPKAVGARDPAVQNT